MNTMDNKENKAVIISTPRLAASFHYVDLRCKCHYVTSDKNHDCDEYETAGTDRIMMVNIIMQCTIPKKDSHSMMLWESCNKIWSYLSFARF